MVEPFDLSALYGEFRDEARGQVDLLDAALLAIEQEGALDEDERARLLRALHTLKGNAGMLGMGPVRDFVHAVEGLFKTPDVGWSEAVLEELFGAASALRNAVERAGTDAQAPAFQRLAEWLPIVARVQSRRAGSAPEPEPPPEVVPAEPEAPAEQPEAAAAVGDVVRVSFHDLDELLGAAGELVGVHAALETLVEQQREALEAAGLRRDLSDQVERLATVLEELRTGIMELRLVPIDRVFTRFPTLARDLAREQGKRVRVVLEGRGTALDKSTVDALAEPLLHLVRNAVDHGIEPPAEREAMGKPAQGTIRLRAERAGDQVRVEVEDDGRGLDRRAILERARQAGLVGEHETPGPAELATVILRPGFSTRAHADQVSGRGIGLDVVQRSVRRLRGRLEVRDGSAGGTCFVLRLPLTVAIVSALFFETEGVVLGVPAADVEETIPRGRPERVGATEVVRHRGELIPVAYPARLFGWGDSGTGARYLVVIRHGMHATAVAADRFFEQRDVMAKALPAYVGTPPGVSGAAVSPTGRVVLLLDAAGLVRLNEEAHRRMRSGE